MSKRIGTREDKVKAYELYTSTSCSLDRLGRRFKVSPTTISKWINEVSREKRVEEQRSWGREHFRNNY